MYRVLISPDLLERVIFPISEIHGSRNTVFEFCEYEPHRKYEKQAQTLHKVPATDVEKWVERSTRSLRFGFELGLSSRVFLTNAHDLKMHIPMLDLKGTQQSGIAAINSFLQGEMPQAGHFSWFASGRSFHAYGDQLLDEACWERFLGCLILLGTASNSPVPDIRWIGHRLKDGFCCLRLTNNSNRFKRVPALLTNVSLYRREIRHSSKEEFVN